MVNSDLMFILSNDISISFQGVKSVSKMATVGESIQISSHTADRVTKAKLTLENFYSNLLVHHEEREGRSVASLSIPQYFYSLTSIQRISGDANNNSLMPKLRYCLYRTKKS